MDFLTGFSIAWKSWFIGLVSYPVLMYVLERFGGAVWQDVKHYAYKFWDWAKSFRGS
jgi:hypothetical protein